MNTKEATDFHLFPLLPTELRLKIWRATLQGPSVIFASKYEVRSPTFDSVTFLSVIQTCHEARSQILDTGLPADATTTKQGCPKYRVCRFPPSFQSVFFSLEIDTLYFIFASSMFSRSLDPDDPYERPIGCPETYLKTDHKHLKHISISLDDFFYQVSDSVSSGMSEHPPVSFSLLPRLYPVLETLTLLIDEIEPPVTLSEPMVTQSQLWATVANMRYDNMRARAVETFEATKAAAPEWQAPVLRFRDTAKFLADPLL